MIGEAASPANLAALDEQSFSALSEPHRRELQAHCYRLLGGLQEAEELVQETLLRAWQRRATYAGRGPLRAWLYKIATNLCLDSLARRPRRSLPVARQSPNDRDDPIPPAITEPIWLEPFPDELLAPDELGPEARYSLQESVTLAFMTALHLLTPRQRAVLILSDVLDWPAAETAELLGVSVPAVKSALHRARATLGHHYHAPAETLSPRSLDAGRRGQLEQYVRAWEAADVGALTSRLLAEASFSMPPTPAWYQGRDNISAFLARTIFSAPNRGLWRLHPTRANGQQAYGLYRMQEGVFRAYGLQVVTFRGDGILDITNFNDSALLGYFGLRASLETT
jgi:RNA polymerase sigma-70 factor (ECF subfamily)